VTVIVALAVGWWVDRSLLTGEIRNYENIEMSNKRGVSGPGMPLKEWRQAEERLQRKWNEMTEAEREQESRRLLALQLPTQDPSRAMNP
jgi:hypothetical protein